MKIILLSSASSVHTVRWANGLQSSGVEIHVISQHPKIEGFAEDVKTYVFPFSGVLGYFAMVPWARRLAEKIKPDLINAHYASGYATTARLIGVHPWLLSVWGSDVYDFPYKSPLHKRMVRKNLLEADAVASTSYCMSRQIRTLASELDEIAITPFGVDMNAHSNFTSLITAEEAVDHLPIVIGTVKSLAPIYGVDVLIRSFALVLNSMQEESPAIAERLRLKLVGDGSQKKELENLARNLGIEQFTTFTGRISHEEVPKMLSTIDIYVALSRQESFGVAIIEAGAAGLPVVVSDAGGLAEVTLHGVTGLVVPKEDPQAAAEAIVQLLHDPERQIRMGTAGQQHVAQHYSWPACIATMLRVYHKTIQNSNKA